MVVHHKVKGIQWACVCHQYDELVVIQISRRLGLPLSRQVVRRGAQHPPVGAEPNDHVLHLFQTYLELILRKPVCRSVAVSNFVEGERDCAVLDVPAGGGFSESH